MQGSYCEFEGLGNISGACDPGYFCSVTSLTEVRPSGAVNGSGPCPKGHWCARGTVRPSTRLLFVCVESVIDIDLAWGVGVLRRVFLGSQSLVMA